MEKFWAKVNKTDSCWLWIGSKTRGGYGCYGGKHVRANRMAWELTYGPIPEGLLVCHKCDTPACVNPDHLFLGTNQDNCDDKISKGRHSHGDSHYTKTHPEKIPRGDRNGRRTKPENTARGEVRGSARLSADDVREIRRSSLSTRKIAPLFGVSAAYVSDLRTRKKWAHLT